MGNLQVLVTSMNQTDTSKYEKMNLQTDAIIANQADGCFFLEEERDGCTVKMITTNTRGLSINRNLAIMYSDAEYIMFADDDQRFVDGYENLIAKELQKCPDADAVKFYCESINRPLMYKRPDKLKKAGKSRMMSTGVPCLVVRRSFLVENCLYFQSNLGSGARWFCGEDSAFFSDFYKAKGKLYVSPILLSYVDQGNSTWYEGITERYIESLGYCYSRIYGKLAILAIYRRAFRMQKNTKEFSFASIVAILKRGMNKQRGKLND